MPLQELSKVWMAGEFVDWADAQVHLLTPTLHYGWGVFEGIRAYQTAHGVAVFQHRAHMARLHRSAAVLKMQIPFTVDELMQATRQLIRLNGVSSCYIRPLAYLEYGEMGLNPLPSKVTAAIALWPWGDYMGADGRRVGVRAMTSSWVRMGANMIPPGTKACGTYVNSSLAKQEAVMAGYDEAVMLDERGHVAEGSGQNIFVVRDGALVTPPVSDRVLRGVTRDAVIEFARGLAIPVKEETILRHDLYLADEAFYTGTAAEIVPIRSVDDREVSGGGQVTSALQELFFRTVAGKEPRYDHMLDHVALP